MKKVCFIGACGHWEQALCCLKNRQDVILCGFAAGSLEENRPNSIDPAIPFFANWQEMLDSVKPDMVILSPVFGLTGRLIIACAERGIDVFSEKPIAASLEEVEQVYKAVCDNGIRFCAMHYLRYEPAFYHGAQMVKSGRIGKVQMITAQKSYRYGTRPDWYKDPSLYCGTIPWVGIHAMDWIYFFTGKKFHCVLAESIGESPEMAALCQFRLEDDVIAAANIDFYRPQTAPTHGDDRIRCVGTQGVLEICDETITVIDQTGRHQYRPDTAPDLLEEFLNGGDPIPLDEIYHITKTAVAAKLSAEQSKPIVIGE